MDRPSEAHTTPIGGARAVRIKSAVEAAVVSPAGGQRGVYLMYEADAVSPEGAVLTGGLLLEVGEEVMLELRLPDSSAVRARVRVVEIVPAQHSMMRVVFIGLGDADRARLARRALASAP